MAVYCCGIMDTRASLPFLRITLGAAMSTLIRGRAFEKVMKIGSNWRVKWEPLMESKRSARMPRLTISLGDGVTVALQTLTLPV